MNLHDITPLVLTFNEEPNLERTLQGIGWANEIIIVDSFSQDRTLEIASRFDNVRLLQRTFDDHTSQWNFGLQQVVTPWVLTLDSDYVCSRAFEEELALLKPEMDVYFARFRYCVFGRRLRSTIYPPRAVLFQPKKNAYVPDGHTQLLDCHNATIGIFESTIDHDDRKPLARWCQSQVQYAKLEAEKLTNGDKKSLGWKDRLRQYLVLAPPLTLVYCLLWKRLLLDGRPGIYYSLQRVFAELLLALFILDRNLRNRDSLR